MREIGRGCTALKKFCGFMNMPLPMQIKSFNEMQQNIASVYQDLANESLQSGSDELVTWPMTNLVKKRSSRYCSFL